MAKLNEAGTLTLQRAFEAHQTRAKLFADERDACWKEFNRLYVEFIRQVAMEMRALRDRQIPLLVEIRRDLGITAEITGFREQVEAEWNRVETQLDVTIRESTGGCRARNFVDLWRRVEPAT